MGQEQHDVFTRRQARLNMLESVDQDRKDSAQDKTWSTTTRLGTPAKRSSTETLTDAKQHDDDISSSAGSSPSLGLHRLFMDEDNGAVAKENTSDAEAAGSRLMSLFKTTLQVTRPPPLRFRPSIHRPANERRKNYPPPAGCWENTPPADFSQY